MPPEDITLHTQRSLALVSPSKRQWLSRPHACGSRVFVGYTMGNSSGSGSSSKTRPAAKVVVSDDSQTASSSSFTSVPPTTTSSKMSSTKRRKAGVLDMSLLLSADSQPAKGYVSLKPKTGTIIQRCVAPPGSSSGSNTPTGPGSKTATAVKKKNAQAAAASSASAAASTNKWSRATDLGNSRSNVPSPREVQRAKVKEQERVKARVEAAAQKKAKKATAAAAVGRRRGSHGKSTRVQSPQDKEEAAVATTTPAIAISGADSANAKDQATANPPYSPRIGLKRTRSVGAGVTPISTSLANSLGAGGAPAVSSPLKAVTGPNTPEDPEAEGQQQRKRSRLSDPTSAAVPEATTKRKASSHSPPTRTADLDGTTAPPPNTVPTATLPLPLKSESVEMRRAASTSNLDSPSSRPSRRSSFGVEARERSRREVMLPGRLRDYDVRSTTPA